MNGPRQYRACVLSCIQLFAIPWIVAHQAPLYMEFSRQEYWSGLPFPSPGDLPNPGIKPRYPTLQADILLSLPQANLSTKQKQIHREQTCTCQGGCGGQGWMDQKFGVHRCKLLHLEWINNKVLPVYLVYHKKLYLIWWDKT